MPVCDVRFAVDFETKLIKKADYVDGMYKLQGTSLYIIHDTYYTIDTCYIMIG